MGCIPAQIFFRLATLILNLNLVCRKILVPHYSSKYVVIDLSIFNNEISNYIFNQRLQSVNGGDSILVEMYLTYKFQQGKAQLYGGELSIDIHPIKHLHFENSLSAVYALNKGIPSKLQTDSNRYLPFVPPFHGISELRFNFDNETKPY